MTQEQRKLVEDNYKMIYFFCKNYRISVEEYHGHLAIGLCNAAMSYDAKKGFAFSTYAMKCMYNAYIQKIRDDNNKQRSFEKDILSLDKEMSNDCGDTWTLADIVSTPNSEPWQNIVSFRLSDILSEKELRICKMYYNGLSQKTIGEKEGCTQTHISRILKRARKKLEKEVVL